MMKTLAAALAAAGFPPGIPASLATVDRTGTVETVVTGTWPDGTPVTHDDCFYAASLTKQITGAALALLVHEGKVDPDAPVGPWLQDLPHWSHVITARQLVHHTAGLPPAGVLEPQVQGHWTTQAVIAALQELRDVSPGTHVYSNAGYILLAELVAAAAAEPFAVFAERRLGVGFPIDPSIFPQAVLLGEQLPLSHGDGGLWTSAANFALWLHRNNRDNYGIESLVTNPAPGSPQYGWGVGLRTYRAGPLLSHGGFWRGASAKAARCPHLGLGVVALVADYQMDRVVALVDTVLDSLADRGKLG